MHHWVIFEPSCIFRLQCTLESHATLAAQTLLLRAVAWIQTCELSVHCVIHSMQCCMLYHAAHAVQVCGEGSTVGDAVVPLQSAFLDGADCMELQGVFHSMSRLGTYSEASGVHFLRLHLIVCACNTACRTII